MNVKIEQAKLWPLYLLCGPAIAAGRGFSKMAWLWIGIIIINGSVSIWWSNVSGIEINPPASVAGLLMNLIFAGLLIRDEVRSTTIWVKTQWKKFWMMFIVMIFTCGVLGGVAAYVALT